MERPGAAIEVVESVASLLPLILWFSLADLAHCELFHRHRAEGGRTENVVYSFFDVKVVVPKTFFDIVVAEPGDVSEGLAGLLQACFHLSWKPAVL